MLTLYTKVVRCIHMDTGTFEAEPYCADFVNFRAKTFVNLYISEDTKRALASGHEGSKLHVNSLAYDSERAQQV